MNLNASHPLVALDSSVRSEVKRCEAEERQVLLVQEKSDLALQLQTVSHCEAPEASHVSIWMNLC